MYADGISEEEINSDYNGAVGSGLCVKTDRTNLRYKSHCNETN